jgi:hypothetical protein
MGRPLTGASLPGGTRLRTTGFLLGTRLILVAESADLRTQMPDSGQFLLPKAASAYQLAGT